MENEIVDKLAYHLNCYEREILYYLKQYDDELFRDVLVLRTINKNSEELEDSINESLSKNEYVVISKHALYVDISQSKGDISQYLSNIIAAAEESEEKKCSLSHDEFIELSNLLVDESRNQFKKFAAREHNTYYFLAIYKDYFLEKLVELVKNRTTHLSDTFNDEKFSKEICIDICPMGIMLEKLLGNDYSPEKYDEEMSTMAYIFQDENNTFINVGAHHFINMHLDIKVMYQLVEVLCHELCHLEFHDHNRDFWHLMEEMGFEVDYSIKWEDDKGYWYYKTVPGKELKLESERLLDSLTNGQMAAYIAKQTGHKKPKKITQNMIQTIGIDKNNPNWFDEYLELKEMQFD